MASYLRTAPASMPNGSGESIPSLPTHSTSFPVPALPTGRFTRTESMPMNIDTQTRIDSARARNSRASQMTTEESHVHNIAQLKLSHAALATEALHLRQSIDDTNRRISAISHFNSKNYESATLDRVVGFARVRAMAILKTGSQEFNKPPGGVSADNSVVQVMMKSAATDCTMREFQLLAAHVRRDPSIPSANFPSDYAVQFPCAAQTSRLDILFESYKGICDTLKLSIHDREVGSYREKRTTGHTVRAIQLLGVDMCLEQRRKILLGRSFPSCLPLHSIPYLQQDRAVWSEGSWERGLTFHLEKLPFLGTPRGDTARRMSKSHTRKTSDLNTGPPLKWQFGITWERLSEASFEGSGTNEVPGTLRSYFPSVVLRTRLLTLSTKQNFEARFNGRYPKQWISTEEYRVPTTI